MRYSPRLRTVTAMLVTSLLGGCGGPQLLTVGRYLAQCDAMQGKPVQLQGYLAECGGYDCQLYANERQSREGISLKTHTAQPAAVGIAADTAFDRKAASFQNRYVVITGRVDDKNCTGMGGTDRSYGLVPTDIRAWAESEGAPAKLIEEHR